MATSFGTTIPTIVYYRIHREGALVRVRVSVGETAGNLVGVLQMQPGEFHVWRRSLHDDRSRLAIHYMTGVFEWLHSGAAVEAEVA